MKNSNFTKQGDAPSLNVTFRTYKYSKDYSAFTGRKLTPGLPLEVDPWPTACNGIDTTTHQDTTQRDTTVKDTSRAGFNVIDLREFAQGTYFVTFHTRTTKVTRRLVLLSSVSTN